MRRQVAVAVIGLVVGSAEARPARVHEAPTAETLTAQVYGSLHPAERYAFLRELPKGADLHSHLSGAVYAETWVALAIEDGLCLDTARRTMVAPPCDAAAGRPTVADATARAADYNRLIGELSTRNLDLAEASGHDQFFVAFERFGAVDSKHTPRLVAELMTRAADQNIAYLELMASPGMSKARKLGANLASVQDTAAALKALEAAGLAEVRADASAAYARYESEARALLGCERTPVPACDVEVRWLAQVIRTFPPEQVFAQTALAVALDRADDNVVGLNFVAPEDDRVSLRDYAAHMEMIRALTAGSPEVSVSLHAGELVLGQVPPEHLRDHIALAVDVAGAKRIGHGVDVLHEDAPHALMGRMAERGVAVEVNLTSNDVILGVSGDEHPFAAYRAAGVPLVLCTDDEGISRINLTHEYARAANTYDLGYADLKALSRSSLTYSFLPGESLFQGGAVAGACAGERLGAKGPAPACQALLDGSAKAREQWDLEAAFTAFEARWAGGHPK